MTKYNNTIVYYSPKLKSVIAASLKDVINDCIKFDSRLEFSTYLEIIKVTPFVYKDYIFNLSICKIKPDFVLLSDNLIAIEVKGFRTRDWVLKWKLFEKEYPRVEKYTITSKKSIKNIETILQNRTFREF